MFKKIMAFFMAAVMAACVLSITAGAESIEDTAKTIKSGKKYSTTLAEDEDADYKIVSSSEGTLKVNIVGRFGSSGVYSDGGVHVYDSKGNKLSSTSVTETTGWCDGTYFGWNRTLEKFDITLNYKISKGTYYIRVHRMYTKGSGALSIKATFPSSSSSSSSSKSACISIAFKKGSTVYLGAAFPTSSSVTWNSSNKSVATVDKYGTVTTKKAGTTIITAKSGSYKAQIQIEVV